MILATGGMFMVPRGIEPNGVFLVKRKVHTYGKHVIQTTS